jgi:hypothetical protein
MGEENVRVSALTRLLLTKYNEPFDETKDICSSSSNSNESKNIKNTMKVYLEDLINLSDNDLYQLTQLYHTKKENTQYLEHFEYTDTEKKRVHEMSFVEDIDIFLKIIMYRKQEILRELASIQKIISVYYNIQVKILNYVAEQYTTSSDDTPDSFEVYVTKIYEYFFGNEQPDIEQNDINKLLTLNRKLEDTLTKNIIDNSEYILINTLDKYELLTQKVTDLCETNNITEFCDK